MGESPINWRAWNPPLRGVANCALAMAGLSLMFLSVAIWNGFPLMFYDTGGYLLEGLAHTFLVERAPVYAELLFLAGARFSLWPLVILQALMISYMILQVARAEAPRLTLGASRPSGQSSVSSPALAGMRGRSNLTSSRPW